MNGRMSRVHTKHFPALAQTLAVFRIYNVDHGVTIIVVTMPYVPDSSLPAQIPELKDGRGEGDGASCEPVGPPSRKARGCHALFWPTVGPILSGVRPGVSL